MEHKFKSNSAQDFKNIRVFFIEASEDVFPKVLNSLSTNHSTIDQFMDEKNILIIKKSAGRHLDLNQLMRTHFIPNL